MAWRFGNPLRWSIADRCLAISLLMTALGVTMQISLELGGWPFWPPATRDLSYLPLLHLLSLASWITIDIIAVITRRSDRPGTIALAIATTTLYAITVAAFTLLTGPFASIGWIGSLGGAVIGYVLFPRWLAIANVVVYVSVVIAGATLASAGSLPAGVLPAELYATLDGATLARTAISTCTMFAIVFTIISYIVDRWRDREQRLERMASIDALTSLTNRRRFMEIASQELARSRRYNSPLALIIADLDHFKRINDTHGHLVGDRALVHAGQVLASAIRDVDVVARYGGEEFAILLPMTDADGAVEVAERCTRMLAASPLTDATEQIRVTASMGVASSSSCTSIDEIIKAADAALYRAKAGGRDRVERATTVSTAN